MPSTGRAAASDRNAATKRDRVHRDTSKSRFHALQLLSPLLGSALVTAASYLDPGSAAAIPGAAAGHALLWSIAVVNLLVIFVQTIAAKLRFTSGHAIREVHQDPFRRRHTMIYGIAQTMTSLTRFAGAALGLALLTGLSLLTAAIVTGIVTYLVLFLEPSDSRTVEHVITGILLSIALSCVVQALVLRPAWGQPAFSIMAWHGGYTLLLAAGVMSLASHLSRMSSSSTAA